MYESLHFLPPQIFILKQVFPSLFSSQLPESSLVFLNTPPLFSLPFSLIDIVHFSLQAPKQQINLSALFSSEGFFYFPANGHIYSLPSFWPYFDSSLPKI